MADLNGLYERYGLTFLSGAAAWHQRIGDTALLHKETEEVDSAVRISPKEPHRIRVFEFGIRAYSEVPDMGKSLDSHYLFSQY